jgi:hypothetical protein
MDYVKKRQKRNLDTSIDELLDYCLSKRQLAGYGDFVFGSDPVASSKAVCDLFRIYMRVMFYRGYQTVRTDDGRQSQWSCMINSNNIFPPPRFRRIYRNGGDDVVHILVLDGNNWSRSNKST